MNRLLIIFVFTAYWLLSAHFLRFNNIALVAFTALLPCLVFIQKGIAIRLLQFGLLISIVTVWLPTTFHIAQLRIFTGEPWIRMALIMSSVVIFNILTILSLNKPQLK